MTLAEKAGQMTQVTLDTISYGKPYKVKNPLRLSPQKLKKVIEKKLVGSVLNVGTHAHTPARWRELIDEIQAAAARTRLGIPVLYGLDTIHGANYVMGSTLFPQQLGLAATGNTELVEQVFSLAARDTLRAGVPWLFAPVADLGRDPRWPRLWEAFGEDVQITKDMTVAATKGIEKVEGAASCLKHFLGYGYPQSGMDRTPAWIPERQLREYYLPPFVSGLAAGSPSVMVNSGEINGEPVHASKFLLTDLLRGELGFDGVVVTDWEDVIYLHTRHRVADSYRSAVKISIEAGIDMSMTAMDTDFADHIVDLVESGELPEARIDESVRRILRMKEKLGLFEIPNPGHDFPAAKPKKDLALATKAAEQSIVLLKNKRGALPLKKQQRILVVGPTANSKRSLHGGWTYTWQGEKTDELDPSEHPTFLAAFRSEYGKKNVRYVQGCNHQDELKMKKLKDKLKWADRVILCLGESSYTEFFGSLDDLYLSPGQEELSVQVAKAKKPTTLLLLQGRPRCISRLKGKYDSILTAFYPGHGGATALSGVLTGRVNPSGRLPLTYPRSPNSLIPYDHKSTENQELQGAKSAFDPEFEFGYGLSYTDFSYRKLKLKKDVVGQNDKLKVSVKVKNTGRRSGGHVVQLYTRTHFAAITPSVRRLRAFQRIELQAGEERTVTFSIDVADLAYIGLDQQPRLEDGKYSLMIGDLEKDFMIAG
ncbi:beta-glucosidase [Lewinellaceae bacterium SD302]|nr:beta-glucosidase [Lewinellaceae bacterium SD302]